MKENEPDKLQKALNFFLFCIVSAAVVLIISDTIRWQHVADEEQANANFWRDKYVASEKALKLYEKSR